VPRDEREVALQIHVSLDTIVEIARHQKREARNADKGIKYRRWGDTRHEERSLDINVRRVDHIFFSRYVGVESMDDTSPRGSLPQVAGDPATPGLESKMGINHS
jgi:hypothetical protein